MANAEYVVLSALVGHVDITKPWVMRLLDQLYRLGAEVEVRDEEPPPPGGGFISGIVSRMVRCLQCGRWRRRRRGRTVSVVGGGPFPAPPGGGFGGGGGGGSLNDSWERLSGVQMAEFAEERGHPV